MVNPYKSPEGNSPPTTLRAVRRYGLASFMLGAIAVLVAFPGFFLLNQDYLKVFPTKTFVSSPVVGGRVISRFLVLCFSLGAGGVLITASVWLATISVKNARKNRILLQRLEEDRG